MKPSWSWQIEEGSVAFTQHAGLARRKRVVLAGYFAGRYGEWLAGGNSRFASFSP